MVATATEFLTSIRPQNPTSKLVCFSFAAYAKTVIEYLKCFNIPVLPGLTDSEFSSIESTFNFSFPPDLRSILQEGLPVGHHFPNWRSSSPQQLKLLLNLPYLNISKNVANNNYWVRSWGDKPDDSNRRLDIVKEFLDKAPVLVPIYGNCYIPSTPNAAGNPVFYVDDGGVRVLSFDVARFFQEVEFLQRGVHFIRPAIQKRPINVPAWAATAARRIEFWTEVAERGRRVVTRDNTHGWWSGEDLEYWELGDCLEDVFWKLRDGGWREEEVREMMMMDGCDQERENGCGAKLGKEDVVGQVRVLSHVLLHAGWSREDVVYSLDLQDHEDNIISSSCVGKFSLDFQIPTTNSSCSRQDDHERSSTKQLMNLRSLEV
ncbi:uncharacterized protein LOC110629659 [Manihot esculenta]|uniref:Uncharacterized protein n=1 Tax=Manihot esculenta TaxID=3983 RepID=A0A2C9URT5_MANES|nr:uncharacterized protein LOC110629659 [Manihot esculenta]OAY33555.1 hypothetical protein MANES_13G106600v8 [Manihot esculenta]